jgi:hypothetical protein
MKRILFVYDKNINLSIISVLYQTPKIFSENKFKTTVLCEGPVSEELKKICKKVKFKTYNALRLKTKTSNKYILFLKFKIEDFFNRKKIKKKIKN